MATRLSLKDLALLPGQAAREELTIALRPYRQGGFDYRHADESVSVVVDINAMVDGTAFRLRLDSDLEGPCARCLEPARLHVVVDTHEVHHPGAGDPELVSDFVEEDNHLDVSGWAEDAVGLEFPHRVLCREDCKGLCATCGADLNVTTCDCEPPSGDSRWDKLKELKLDES